MVIRYGREEVFCNLIINSQSFSELLPLVCDLLKSFFVYSFQVKMPGLRSPPSSLSYNAYIGSNNAPPIQSIPHKAINIVIGSTFITLTMYQTLVSAP